MKKILLYILLLICAGLYGQSNQNYIRTRTYTNEAGTVYLDRIQYFDGLGRLVQTVQRGITPNVADLVSLQEYDAFGRESNSWLPAVLTGNNGAYVTPETIKTNAITSNGNDQKPYSSLVYEDSPLNRVLEQYGPGQDWHNNGKKVSTAYLTNIAGDARFNCKLYLAGGNNQSPTLSQITNYATGQLYVTEIKDEDGNTSYEFKNTLGQIVLTRQMEGSTAYDTYYVYNNFGNQCYVLPPRIQDEGIAQTKLDELAYQYKYDNRNRCIWKKLPGCEPIRYVYDKADRLVYTQDGVQYNKSPKEWTFIIPDAFGRVVLTGICKDTIPVSNKVVKGVYASTGSYKRYNIQVDGVNKTFTNTPSILSVNFYDNYDFRDMAEIPASGTEYNPETGYGTWYGTDYTEANKYKNKGMLTGTLTAQMNYDGTISSTPSSYLYSVMYYDSRGRLIQTKGNNQLAGGIEKEYIAYNFTGQPVKKLHVHTRDANGGGKLTELYTYTYDHAGRLLTTTHQLTDGTTVKPQVTLSENTYDDLGRLKTNKKGGQANLNSTYAYNVRSWTKSITSPLFTEILYYNESYGGSVKQYNSNISAMSWKHNTETNPRGYAFVYDNLSRLIKANYLINGTVQTYNASTPTNPIFQTAYSYDKHGNMKTLQRYGNIDAAKYGLIDNLTMTYAGNQMTRVDEAVAAISFTESMDFKNGSNVANEYTYNVNGAMNKDLNKGITEIQYNSLNLPRQMIINSSSVKAKNYYTYSALGVKLKTEQRYDPNYTVTPSNATNPTNDGLADYKNTDYAGNIIYETVKRSSTITNKTRILVDGGYIEGGVYYYYLTDHLGNNRVVANASGTVIQRNHYYPFGMSFADTPLAEQGKQPYKYNGKELDQMHGLNLYDNLARLYDPVIPHTPTPDPHAENYYSWSPYAWVGNNPMKYIDPNGMDWWTTSDAAEIERVLASLKSGETVNSQEFGDQWTRVEEVSENDYAIFDDQTSDFTIDGVPYKDFKGYGKNSVGFDFLADLAGLGLASKGGTITMFMQQSMDKNKFLRNSYYSIAYSGQAMSNKISLSKTRINIGSVGTAIGWATFSYTAYTSVNDYRTNKISGVDAGFNVGLAAISMKIPQLGITYSAVGLLHPGGWAGWRENMNSLSKYAYEPIMYGPKF